MKQLSDLLVVQHANLITVLVLFTHVIEVCFEIQCLSNIHLELLFISCIYTEIRFFIYLNFTLSNILEMADWLADSQEDNDIKQIYLIPISC
jgi:hypothetical protein